MIFLMRNEVAFSIKGFLIKISDLSNGANFAKLPDSINLTDY